MVTTLLKLWRTETDASNLFLLFLVLSFSKRSASMLLTRKNEEAGRQAKSRVGWVESHRGLLGSRGRRARLWRGEAVRARRSNGTNEGGGGGSGGEILTGRSRPRGPASSGVAARASRRGRIAAETNTDTKARPLPAWRGPSPDTHWMIKAVLYRMPGKAATRSSQREDQEESPSHWLEVRGQKK